MYETASWYDPERIYVPCPPHLFCCWVDLCDSRDNLAKDTKTEYSSAAHMLHIWGKYRQCLHHNRRVPHGCRYADSLFTNLSSWSANQPFFPHKGVKEGKRKSCINHTWSSYILSGSWRVLYPSRSNSASHPHDESSTSSATQMDFEIWMNQTGGLVSLSCIQRSSKMLMLAQGQFSAMWLLNELLGSRMDHSRSIPDLYRFVLLWEKFSIPGYQHLSLDPYIPVIW